MGVKGAMNRVGTLASSMLFSILAVPAGLAQGLSVDWKFYGGASLQGNSDFCFYDAKGVAQARDGHIRVWTKCLSQKDLDGIDVNSGIGKRIVDNTAKKIVEYYMPPIADVETLTFDQIMQNIQYEQITNMSDIAPRARIFYELSCSEQMLRELSIHIQAADGKSGSHD
jgi:hypothetical protein